MISIPTIASSGPGKNEEALCQRAKAEVHQGMLCVNKIGKIVGEQRIGACQSQNLKI